MSLGAGGTGSTGGCVGDYTLVDELGSGGMGVVHLGLSPSGRHVAIKVVHPQYARDREFRARFRQEVAAARRVSGAFTAPVVDADPDAEQPWMATLYVPGRTLTEAVAEDGPLTGRALRTLALGLVEALRDIHRAGVVHRDLKPSNVLVADDGPRVIDFGISRAADNEDLTVTGRLIGTPPFMSPEQFAAPRDVTAASDVFSLGSVLAYASTGNRPFEGGSPYLTGYRVMHEAPVLDGVPEPLRAVVARCLDKDPAARPPLDEVQAMLLALPERTDAAARPAPVSAAAPTPAPSGTAPTVGSARGAGRRRTRLALVALASALAVTAGAVTAARLTDDAGTRAGDTAGSTSPVPAPGLPAGWRAWRTTLATAVEGEPLDNLESGCVPGGTTAVYCAGTGFTTARLDAATGRTLWRSGDSPQTSRPIGVRDGHVYAYLKPDSRQSYRPRLLVALDERTGRRLWSRPVREDEPSLLFDGGVVTTDNEATHFVAYDAAGRRLWRTPAASSAGNACAAAVFGGSPYGLCTAADDPAKGATALVRLDPSGGTARELARLPALATGLGTVGGQPLLVAPDIARYGSAKDGDWPYTALLRVDPGSGAVERLALAAGTRGTPTLVGGVVYFVRPDGTVTAVRAADGTRLWQRGTGTENLSAPVLSTRYDSLYLANRFGRLTALDPATGAVRWRTGALADPGDSAQDTTPYLRLVRDAIVAVAGDTAFSVRPDRPAVPAR
ncbi:serine/threonine-protein kinase [Streptomyces doudnae]|uniref:Serine/threonine-protein kinase n=3 Tax=Streptomyces TaxID=1883 RepID=A0ABD5EY81_9ACTN|nr:serine/threonine-protein kinase [Streptomyces sp. DSM 41981]MDT0439615.1 serine/threonine-protein kinase [Streptomyces sp. DSM 41981]